MRSLGLQIEAEGKQGWSFGGYISTDFRRLTGGSVGWTVENVGAPTESGLTIVLYDTRSRKQYKITTWSETGAYELSENRRYLATDSGTDISGGIHIFDVQNGKVLVESGYMPRDLEWKGNTIIYNAILCYDDGFAITEEMQFDNGKVRKSGRFKKTPFHQGVEVGGCKKYMHLLK
jgi:hypothetical protein